MTLDELFNDIQDEVERQDESWGTQDYVPDDRWKEITEDEFRDLAWSVRMCERVEKEKHDINHELIQTIATLSRWYLARNTGRQ